TCGHAALSCLSPETRTRASWRDPGPEAGERGLAMTGGPGGDQVVLLALGGSETGPDSMEALTVPLGPGGITPAIGAGMAREDARRGRAMLGASLAAWLDSQDPGPLAAKKVSLAARFAGEWRDEGHTPATARMLAEMSAGWALMLGYLEQAGTCRPE